MTRLSQRLSPSPLLLAVSIVLAGLLYWRALLAPIYHDDVVILRAVSNAQLGDIFVSTIGLGYYRPVSLATWKLYQLLWGQFPPLWLHLHNVAMHGVAGWLVGLLCLRVSPRLGIALLGAALYVTFPFSYQQVPWAVTGAHNQVAVGTLAAILLLDSWWERGERLSLAGSWLCLLLATFSHPNGSVSAILAAMWLVGVRAEIRPASLRQAAPRLALALVPCFAISAAYFAVWLSLPQSQASGGRSVGEIGWNLAYLMQGLAYPVAQLGGEFVRRGSDALATALIIDIVGLLTLLGLFWQGRQRLGLFGIGWHIIAIMPTALQLGSGYVVDGPRLMLLASCGVALAWARAIEGIWDRLNHAWRLVPIGLASFIVISGAWFVETRMRLLDPMSSIYWQWIEASNAESEAVVVNLPDWIAPVDRVYALGSEGISYLGDYYPARDMVWANRNVTPLRMIPRAMPETAPGLRGYHVSFAGENRPFGPEQRFNLATQVDQVMWVTLVNGRWELASATAINGQPPDSAVEFENGLRLVAQAKLAPSRGVVVLNLVWMASHATQDANIFAHVLCGEEMIGQADAPPMNGIHPFSQWQSGEGWHETRLAPIPNGYAPECLSLTIGLYDPLTNRRVKLTRGGDAISFKIQSIP